MAVTLHVSSSFISRYLIFYMEQYLVSSIFLFVPYAFRLIVCSMHISINVWSLILIVLRCSDIFLPIRREMSIVITIFVWLNIYRCLFELYCIQHNIIIYRYLSFLSSDWIRLIGKMQKIGKRCLFQLFPAKYCGS